MPLIADNRGSMLIVLQGAIRWTIYGALACTVGHLSWPLFR